MRLDLEAIKARAEAASLGPWLTADPGPYIHSVWEDDGSTIASNMSPSDARFICSARTAVPALVAEIERLSGDLEIAYGVIHTYQVEHDGKPDDGTAARIIDRMLQERSA